MSKKKLSSVEINVLSNEINKRINDVKYEKIKSKLEKDVDFKNLNKLNNEIIELNKKVNEKNKLYNELVLKVRNKFEFSNVYRGIDNEIKVLFNNNNLYNEIVLFNINKDLNVDDLINSIVKKYV